MPGGLEGTKRFGSLAGAALLLTTLLVACGGEVRTNGPDESTGGSQSSTTPDRQDEQPDPSGGNGSGADDLHGREVDLPECRKGTPVAEADVDSCVYLHEERCYDTKLAACACACKRQSGTVCASGFPVDGVPTEVNCF